MRGEVFRAHVAKCAALRKMCIRDRLKPWLEKIPGAVLHCFTGSRSEVQECLDLGLFIGDVYKRQERPIAP